MKLSVKNLGVIQSGEIELKGITVIAGKNGTGKSTMGKILYCLGRTFYRAESRAREETERQLFQVLLNEYAHEWGASRLRPAQKSLESIIDNYTETGEIILPKEFVEINKSLQVQKTLKDRLKTILDIDTMEIIKSLFLRVLQAEFGGRVTPVNNPRRVTQISLKKDEQDFISIKILKEKEPVFLSKNVMDKDVVFIDDPYILDTTSKMAGINQVLSRFSHRADLETKIMYDADKNSVINDILAEKTWTELNKLIAEMSGGGVINRDDSGFEYKSPEFKEPLSIESLSTGLKSILLIKTLIENGSLNNTGVVILDEPEVHLHPEWQFKLARILVLLPKVLNIKVMLSTHSADFLSAINYYTREYEMEEVTKYYQMQKDGDYSQTKDVTNQLDLIYKDLSTPFISIADKL